MDIIKGRYHPPQGLVRDRLQELCRLQRNAEEQAAQTTVTARRRCAARLRQARARARERGVEAGRREGLSLFTQKLSDHHESTENALAGFAADARAAVFQLAREVIQEELSASSASLNHRIERAIAGLRDRQNIRILVHPNDLPRLRAMRAEGRAGTQVAGDSAIKQGNARIESSIGTIELDWEKHFDTIIHFLGQGAKPR